MSGMDGALTEFSVSADRDGEMTLEHYPPNGQPWCWWSLEVHNGTALPELAELARKHLADEARRCVNLTAPRSQNTM